MRTDTPVLRFAPRTAVVLLAALVATASAWVLAQERAGEEWRYYGGDHAFTRYSPLDQITRHDIRSGKLVWTFHVVPQQGEPGAETWGNESRKYAGDLGAWNPLSADDELGYVYLPLTTPSPRIAGGGRAKTCTRTASSRSMPGQAGASGTTR